MTRKLKDDPKSVARRDRYKARKATKLAATAVAQIAAAPASVAEAMKPATDMLAKALAVEPRSPQTHSTAAQRAKWTLERVYNTAGQSHFMDEAECTRIGQLLGGEAFMEATGAQFATKSRIGSLLVDLGVTEVDMDGHPAHGVDILPVGEDIYNLRFITSGADPDTIPDALYLGGTRIIRVVRNVPFAQIRATLEAQGIQTTGKMSETRILQKQAASLRRHVQTCDCKHCEQTREKAKTDKRDILDIYAEGSPPTQDLVSKLKAAEQLAPVVQGIEKAADRGTEVDAETDRKVAAALMRSTIIVPDTNTVN